VDEEVGDDFEADHEPSKDNTKYYDFRPRQPIEFIPIADHYRESEYAFASHVHKLHKELSDGIAQNNANHKL